MIIDITWNSGVHQRLEHIDRIVQYGFDGKDDRLCFQSKGLDAIDHSLAIADVKKVTILPDDGSTDKGTKL